MQYTPNYQLKLPEASDVVNISDLNNNFMVLDDIIKTSIEQFMKNFYPVGSVYINATDDRNPNEILGFGSWQRIGNGRVLIDASSSRPAGTTGGAETVTLTAAQSGVHEHNHATTVTQPVFRLPNHHHHVSAGWNSGGDVDRLLYGTVYMGSTPAGRGDIDFIADPKSYPDCTRITDVAVSVSNSSDSDASQAHENMPPYLSVYIWKRTA